MTTAAVYRRCLGMPGEQCTEMVPRGRCVGHEAAWQRRKNAGRPGYSSEHARMRKQLAPLVEQGVACARCGRTIEINEQWDADRINGGWAPSHASCNRAAH